MGGFLIVPSDGETLAEVRLRVGKSLSVFEKRGLAVHEQWCRKGAYVAVFRKKNGASPHVESTDLVRFSVGTPLGKRGAFAEVAETPSGWQFRTDRVGSYPVFRTEGGIVASSFLAARCAEPTVSIAPQGLYEYVLGGACYGEGTYLQEVCRVAPGTLHLLEEGLWSEGPQPPVEIVEGESSELLFERSRHELESYFRDLGGQFGDSIAMGLTAGFDSRLMLAILDSLGVQPKVFVRGGKNAKDVRIARAICDGQNIPLYRPSSKRTKVPLAALPNHVARLLLDNDGLTDGGSVALSRLDDARSPLQKEFEGAALFLSGGGGEIFRDYWELPDGDHSVDELISHGFKWKTRRLREAATGRLDTQHFYENLGLKLQTALGAESQLTRAQVALAYPFFRVRHWTASFLLGHQPYRHALLPFAEPALIASACSVPAKQRFDGAWEARLINSFSPRIASYPSGYDHNFSGAIPWRRRAQGWARRHSSVLPESALLAARNVLSPTRERAKAPLTIAQPQVWDALFGTHQLQVSDYFRLAGVNELPVVARGLTVEAVLRGPELSSAV